MTSRRRAHCVAAAWWLAFVGPATPAPAPAAVTTVRMELIGGLVYVPVTVDGRQYRFVLDSGADEMLTPGTAAQLRLATSARPPLIGAGERSVSARSAMVASLRIGAGELRNVRVAVSMLPPSLSDIGPGLPFGGVIGHAFLRRFVTTIRYRERTVSLRDAGDAGPAARLDLPATMFRGMPAIDAVLDGRSGTYAVDTGNAGPVVLLRSYADHQHLEGVYPHRFAAILGEGVGGYVRGEEMRGTALVLGGVTVGAPILYVADQRAGFFTNVGIAGIVGTDVLRHFDVTLDLPHHRVGLTPVRGVGGSRYNRAGVYVDRPARELVAVDVVAGGPAADAGMAEGDRIVAVAHRRASDLPLSSVRELLQGAAGTAVTLTVARGGRRFDVTVILRDFL